MTGARLILLLASVGVLGCAGADAPPHADPVPHAEPVAAPSGAPDVTSTAPDEPIAPPPPPEPAPPPDPRKEVLDLAFAGDVMFGRFVNSGFREIPAERHDPWAHVAAILDSDFTMVNLETPVVRDPPKKSPWSVKMRFVASPERVATLKAGNIDAVTLANNHSYDMRTRGIEETPQILDELGILHVGATRKEPPVLRAESFTIEGWKVAFVPVASIRNANQREGEPELPYADWDQVGDAIAPVVAAARADHDLVIVVVHWGLEYKDAPEGWRVDAARQWIDAGADAVIGHHPHVLQGIERYGDGLIAYSLGNFLFDNLATTRRLHGVLHVRFRRGDGAPGGCLDGATFHPTVGTRPYFFPKPAGEEFETVAKRLQKLSASKPLRKTAWRVDGDTLVVDGACAARSE